MAGSWYRLFYRYVAETRLDQRSVSAVSCAAGRGGERPGVFLLNDFVIAAACSRWDPAVVNAPGFIPRRGRLFAGTPDAFVAVEFTEVGGAMQAVDQLNRAGTCDPS